MDADDVFDTVSGTLGLTGAADSILVLSKRSGKVVLSARGRDIEDKEIALRFDPATCRWEALGDADDVIVSDQRSKILAALDSAPEPMSPKELMLATGNKNRNAVDLSLMKMLRDGQIGKAARGKYTGSGKIGKKDASAKQTAVEAKEISAPANLSDLSAKEGPGDAADEKQAGTLVTGKPEMTNEADDETFVGRDVERGVLRDELGLMGRKEVQATEMPDIPAFLDRRHRGRRDLLLSTWFHGLPGARSNRQRTASGIRRCHAVGRTGGGPATDAAIRFLAWATHGALKPAGEDFAMLRLVLLALLPVPTRVHCLIPCCPTSRVEHLKSLSSRAFPKCFTVPPN